MREIVLRPGRDRSLRRRHPWVLSGAVAELRGDGPPGEPVRVLSAEGEVLGTGDLSPASALRVRMLAFGKEALAPAWLEERLRAAVVRRREQPLLAGTDAVRLVNAEGDHLPGLVVDRYADCAVVVLTTAAMHARREEIARTLRDATGASAGFERADTRACRQEGVPARQGALWGAAPEAPIPILERGRRYAVDVVHGQKTGFYLDQRDARDRVERLAAGRRVLDLFCYTGGFALAAVQGGARHVTAVDGSAPALEHGRAQREALGAGGAGVEWVRADAFRSTGPDGDPFELVVVDPPPLARRSADAPRAVRALRELLARVLRRAAPDAFVLAFSCSHHVDRQALRKAIFQASLQADLGLRVLEELGAPVDHPVSLDHPEGAYLSGLLLQVAGP